MYLAIVFDVVKWKKPKERAGSRTASMSRKGLYNRLFNLQAQWYVA